MEHSRRFFMDEPAQYRIRVFGRVSDRWMDELGSMKPTVLVHPGGLTETELCGEVTDQAALLGIINLLYDLGNALLVVQRLEAAETDGTNQEA